jgi:hypothetical protein
MPIIGTNHVWRVKHFQELDGQQVLNVYHYQIPDGPLGTNAPEIAAAFEATVVDEIRTIQDISVSHVLLQVEQLGSLTDFTEVALSGTGELVGQDLANFVAMRFDYLRTTKETRNGAKRICGLNEEVVFGNSYDAAFFTLMQGVAVVLGSNLSAGFTAPQPVIVGIRYVPDSDPREELPVAEWVFNPVSEVVANPIQTTQNTRKRGRGA